MLRHVRLAARLLRRHWFFSLTAIAILALCIGVNAAVLAVVDVLLVRPLPYPEPDRLAQIVAVAHGDGAQAFDDSHTGRTWEAIRDGVSTLDAAVWGGATGVNLAVGGSARYVQQHRVSAGYFGVLGVSPTLGREFTRADDQPNGPPVAILAHALWRTGFHADRAIIGRTVFLRGEPYTVLGVMPEGFQPLVQADVWTPLRPARTGEGGGNNYGIIARVRPGATWQAADAELVRISVDLAKERGVDAGRAPQLHAVNLQSGLSQWLWRPVQLLWSAVLAVFVIGCVNIGGMLLARGSARAGEMATRLALGARPSDIVTQLMTEAIMLALAGAAAAVVLGRVALSLLRYYGAESWPALETATLDWRVLAVTLLLALVAGVGFGVLPAWQASRVDLRSAQAGGGRTVAGRRRFVSLGLLVGGQVALTVPLLIGSGLLLRTFTTLWNASPGFDPDDVVTARFSLEDARYASAAATRRLLADGVARLGAIPGVERAAVTLSLPYERALNMPFQRVAGGEASARRDISNLSYVTPGVFEALRVPLLQGRVFTDADGPSSARVAVINDAFARMYFPDRPAIGELIRSRGDTLQIVGIVGSVQQRRAGWGNFGPVGPVPNLYVPVAQVNDGFLRLVHTWFSPSWVVRSQRPPADVIAAVDRTMRAVDPMLPIAAFRSIADLKRQSLLQQQFLAMLVATLGGLALALSALGLYGLLANLVAERTRELGIRVALGSTRRAAVRTAVRPGLMWVAIGIVFGAAVTLPATRLLRSFLWGVTPTDPTSIVGAAGALLVMALAATLVPALRILRLNPADTLRAE
jgi:predicted permease